MTVHINWECSLTAFCLFFTLNIYMITKVLALIELSFEDVDINTISFASFCILGAREVK